MSSANETVAEIAKEMKERVGFRAYYDGGKYHESIDEDVVEVDSLHDYADRIESAHKRDRETARRRAERSAINNMLESFPYDWECNPEVVSKWLATWQKYADDLCEGGKYAE